MIDAGDRGDRGGTVGAGPTLDRDEPFDGGRIDATPDVVPVDPGDDDDDWDEDQDEPECQEADAGVDQADYPELPAEPSCGANACKHGASCLDPTSWLTCKCPEGATTPACGSVRFRSLGNTGEYGTSVTSLSGDGSTAVGVVNAKVAMCLELSRAFRWTVDTGIVLLELPAFGFSPHFRSAATGSNVDGTIIVGWQTAPGWEIPFRWQNGATDILGLVDFLPSGGAYDVSADGTVIACTVAGLPQSAFRWTDATGFAALDPGPSATERIVNTYAISGDGRVVVGASTFGVTTPGDQYYVRPARWRADTGVELLPDLPGVLPMIAEDINFDGSIIVGTGVRPDHASVALLWSDAGARELVLLPGTSTSAAFGVNADGSVVVGSSDSVRATIWTEQDGVRAIDDILVDAGVDLSGWNLFVATQVSDDGKVVAGAGSHVSQAGPVYWIAWLP